MPSQVLHGPQPTDDVEIPLAVAPAKLSPRRRVAGVLVAREHGLTTVAPAKAGVQFRATGFRLRGNDGNGCFSRERRRTSAFTFRSKYRGPSSASLPQDDGLQPLSAASFDYRYGAN